MFLVMVRFDDVLNVMFLFMLRLTMCLLLCFYAVFNNYVEEGKGGGVRGASTPLSTRFQAATPCCNNT